MNPFALHGPAFLGFYAATGIFALLLQYFWSRAKEAAGVALATLAPYLSRYNRSVAGNAAELAGNVWP